MAKAYHSKYRDPSSLHMFPHSSRNARSSVPEGINSDAVRILNDGVQQEADVHHALL